MSFPQDLFLPRDFQQFLFLWALLRDQPSWGSSGYHCSCTGRAGALLGLELPQGSQNPASSSMPQHWFCSWALPSFLPSFISVSISCLHFQWLGILWGDEGGLQHVSGVIYSSAFSPSCLFCWSFEIKYYSSRREEKKYEKILLNPR